MIISNFIQKYINNFAWVLIAKTNNWQRQIQVNGEILSSLNNIIDELEQG